MKQHLQAMLAAVASVVPDGLMMAGAGALSYGAWLIYQPAGWLVGGALVLVAGVKLANVKPGSAE